MAFARVPARILSLLARSATVLPLVVFAFLAHSVPSARAESIWLEPAEGTPGTTVTIKGDLIGCYRTGPGPLSSTWGLPDTINFYWDPGSLYSDSAEDPNDMNGLQKVGSWSLAAEQPINISFTVPANATPGQHRFVAELKPKCNYKSLDQSGKVVDSDEPSYTSAVFCVLGQAGGPCVEYGGGGAGQDGGGRGNGVSIAVIGALVTVALGAVVIAIVGLSPALRARLRAMRSLPPSVDRFPERCRGLGGALHEATANVTMMNEIKAELGAKLAKLKRAQKNNIVKAALGGLVNGTVIVASGVSEMAAARRAALAARAGLGVKEHWVRPSAVSPRLRSAIEVAEKSLTAAREFVGDLRRRIRLDFLGKRAEMINAYPEMIRARQVLSAAEDGVRQAEAQVGRLMGSDPARSPRARYERARGLLSGREEGERLLRKEAQDIEAELSSRQLELRNRLLSGQAADQPLEPWMQEFLEAEGPRPAPGGPRVSRGGAYDPQVVDQLRREIDLKTAAKQELDARIRKRNEFIEQALKDQEKAFADLGPLEAAERDLAFWKTSRAAADEQAKAVESTIDAWYEAQKNQWLEEIYAAENRARQLEDEVDDLRAQVQAEGRSTAAANVERVGKPQTAKDLTGTAESAPPEKAAPGKPGVLRQGATIVKELVLGVDTQSPEEVGDILREGRQYIELTETRLKALARAIEEEQKRVVDLTKALAECTASEGAAAAAEAERRAANRAADERWRNSG